MSADELIDVVDSRDHVVGVVPRSRLVDPGLNYRVVHVLLVDSAGDLLVQRIAAGRARTFTLGSSVAGHVRSGESYEAAARRETIEELGVTPVLTNVGKTWLDEGSWRKFIGVFVGRANGPLRIDAMEVAAVESFALSLVRTMLRSEPEAFSPTFHRVFRHVDAKDVWGNIA